jgi:transposase-like protein
VPWNVRSPKGFGRIRLSVLSDASAQSLSAFLADHVEPGATIVSDGWSAYLGATADYYHVPIVGKPHELPGVHRATALVKRWLLSTHHGSVDPAHLPGYLNEFVFRFNRRSSRRRGLLFLRALELAVAHHPVRYRRPRPHRRPTAKANAEAATARRTPDQCRARNRQPALAATPLMAAIPLICGTPVRWRPQSWLWGIHLAGARFAVYVRIE